MPTMPPMILQNPTPNREPYANFAAFNHSYHLSIPSSTAPPIAYNQNSASPTCD